MKFNRFKPQSSLDAAFVSPEWLKTVRLSRSQFKDAENLMSFFFRQHVYSIVPNEAEHYVDANDYPAFSPPLSLRKFLKMARKDPYAVVALDLYHDNSKLSPVMTLLDFVRTLLFVSEMSRKESRGNLRSFTVRWQDAKRPHSDLTFAEARGSYLVSLFLNLFRDDEALTFIAPPVKYFEKTLRHPDSASFFREVAHHQKRTSVRSPGVTLEAVPEGVFIMIPPKLNEALLVDDTFLRTLIDQRNLSEDRRFLVFKSKYTSGLSLRDLFPEWDHVFLETSNIDFSLEFMLLNIEAKYPSVTEPGCAPPNFKGSFADVDSQRVYLLKALNAAKDLHDQLIHSVAH